LAKTGMKRHLVPWLVLFALVSCGACARSLATAPLNAGVAAAGQERWDEAIQYWKKALEQDPNSAPAHNNLAVAYEKRGALEEAGREYEAALRLDPGNALIKGNYESFKDRLAAGRGRLP
jgi:Tfp pilus assembly protein PilF